MIALFVSLCSTNIAQQNPFCSEYFIALSAVPFQMEIVIHSKGILLRSIALFHFGVLCSSIVSFNLYIHKYTHNCNCYILLLL